MKKSVKVLIAVSSIVFLSNTWPGVQIMKTFVDEKHYRYSNYDGTYTSYEFMSRNFEMMKRNHKTCLSTRTELKDKKLYRLFSKNPFVFWRWRLYFFDERYKLPYRDWEEIEKIRGDKKKPTGCLVEF